MKKIILASLLFIYSVSIIQAQNYNPLEAPNSYQSADNPHYWKNKLPKVGYWQQDVHYRIKATIDDKKNDIIADQKLSYWNNSPDELTVLYFHLYQNAYTSGSYLESFRRDNKSRFVTKKKGYPENMGTEIKNFEIQYPGSKEKVKAIYQIDNTILKCELKQALNPGEKIDITISFITHWDPANSRRFAVYKTFGQKHFNGTHWYPRISVYDSKFGWTTDQHLGKEFYGDFGTYDVELTFPNNYIV
ncbi:MAG: M1 family peptidase, partial [Bacteroidia bacterium]|nr:M1 family peptidase [Bacteroidia bacterium]